MGLKRIINVCGILALAVVPSFANIYDAVNDFPTIAADTSAVSANGVWSYGFSTGINPVVFSPGTASPNWFGLSPDPAAGFGDGVNTLPTVLKNISGGTLDHLGGSIGPWPTDLLLLHPGGDGAYAVVQFTAPSAATYVVSGEFLAIGNSDQNSAGVTSDSAEKGLTTLFATSSTSTPQFFSFNTTLAEGDSLDFAVGLGPQGQFSFDSTGFDATIATTPEPGFYGVLALGLTGLVAVVRRRRNA